jgi:hypothetical protein
VKEAKIQVSESPIDVQRRITICVRDFFSDATDGPYDLAWDCTFLCALPPAQREKWAARYAALLKPGGTLVSLVFPIFPDDHAMARGGPPFGLTPAAVRALLEPLGFAVVEERNPLPEAEAHLRRGPTANVGSALLVFTKVG